MYIAVKIHNNSLGRVVEVEGEDRAKEIIREWAREQFGRGLTGNEIYELDNNLELFNDDDPDNIYSFSVGIVEKNYRK